MKVLYLDESGTINVNEKKQPFLLFSGPLLDNRNINTIKEKVSHIIKECKNKISNTIYWKMAKGKYDDTTASKLSNFIAKKIIPNEFEIHTGQLIRGDNEYMVLKKKDRIDFAKKMLEIIKDNNIKIICVICDKRIIAQDNSIADDKKNAEVEKRTCTILADQFDLMLKKDNYKATLILDKGNKIIQNTLKPYIWTKTNSNICHEIIEYHSHEHPLIQLADVCCFVIANYHKSLIKDFMNSDDRKLAKELYAIIENNIIMWNVKDFYVIEEENREKAS